MRAKASYCWNRFRNGLLRQFPGREASAVADQAVVSATNFLTAVMLLRFMGLREFRVFTLAWMSVLFVNSLQTALIVAPMMSIPPKTGGEGQALPTSAPFVFQELVLVSFLFCSRLRGSEGFLRLLSMRICSGSRCPWRSPHLHTKCRTFCRRYFFATRQSRRALADDALSYLTQLPILFLLHRAGHLNSATALWTMAGTSIVGLAPGWFWMEPLDFNWKWIKVISLRHWRVSRWLTGSAMLRVDFQQCVFDLRSGLLWSRCRRRSESLAESDGRDPCLVSRTGQRRSSGDCAPLRSGRGALDARLHTVDSGQVGRTDLIYSAIVMAAAPGFWLRLDLRA